jgi:putative transposase
MTGSNPTDRGKRGTKRHVLTDQLGIPISVVSLLLQIRTT